MSSFSLKFHLHACWHRGQPTPRPPMSWGHWAVVLDTINDILEVVCGSNCFHWLATCSGKVGGPDKVVLCLLVALLSTLAEPVLYCALYTLYRCTTINRRALRYRVYQKSWMHKFSLFLVRTQSACLSSWKDPNLVKMARNLFHRRSGGATPSRHHPAQIIFIVTWNWTWHVKHRVGVLIVTP